MYKKAPVIEEKTSDPSKSVQPVKETDATPQRPDGDRILDAELVELNLFNAQEQIKSESAWLNSDRNAMTLFKSEDLRIVLIALHEGAELKTHRAPGMITVQVLDGEIRFKTERQESILGKSEMLVLHSGIPHSVFAQKETVFLLTIAVTK